MVKVVLGKSIHLLALRGGGLSGDVSEEGSVGKGGMRAPDPHLGVGDNVANSLQAPLDCQGRIVARVRVCSDGTNADRRICVSRLRSPLSLVRRRARIVEMRCRRRVHRANFRRLSQNMEVVPPGSPFPGGVGSGGGFKPHRSSVSSPSSDGATHEQGSSAPESSVLNHINYISPLLKERAAHMSLVKRVRRERERVY